MEMPIKIIIVLFVAIVVGIMIINFTTTIIEDSKRKLGEFYDDKEVQEDMILELVTITSKQIGIMAKDCFEKHSNVDIEGKLCYVLIGAIDANEADIKSYSRLEDEKIEVNLANAHNAVRIRYNAALDKVQVSG